MREDQFTKLQDLHAKLVDVALQEADPEAWSGAGIAPKDLSQQDRGDRYWCKKNAVATISLAVRIDTLLGKVQGFGVTPGKPADDDGEDPAAGLLDAEVNAAEREAKKLLVQFQKKAGASA